jgi:hypothetical protein
MKKLLSVVPLLLCLSCSAGRPGQRKDPKIHEVPKVSRSGVVKLHKENRMPLEEYRQWKRGLTPVRKTALFGLEVVVGTYVAGQMLVEGIAYSAKAGYNALVKK